MSYDLMVFDPASAPAEHSEFMNWYEAQTEWSEGHSYNDPVVSTEALRKWFHEIAATFPPMNGPLAVDEPEDEAAWTDYSVGRVVIYAAFAWSEADRAYETVFSLAQKHGLGFFNVSSDGAEVWLPSGAGDLFLAHTG